MRFFWLNAVIAAWMCFSLAAPAGADVLEAEQETWRRITTAGDQRILVQMIERSACFLMTSVETERFSGEASLAVDRFQTNLAALSAGSEPLALQPETAEEVIARLQAIDEIWATFGAAARQVMNGDLHAIPVRQLIELDDKLHKQVQQSAIDIRDVYQDRLIARKRMATTIDLASRQQMLAMRMSKAFCYISLDINRQAMTEQLKQDLDLFASGLNAMEFGDYDLGVVDPPSLAALMAVSQMTDAWAEMQPHMQSALEAPDDTRDRILAVADTSSLLSDLAGQMIEIYLK